MIAVEHVDSIFGSLLPIRLSTFKLVFIIPSGISIDIFAIFTMSKWGRIAQVWPYHMGSGVITLQCDKALVITRSV